TGRVYLDGSLDGSIGGCTSIFAGYTSPNMEIGGHSTNGPAPTDAYFSGSIDEVRLSYIARSADWIKTEYNNQSLPGTFITMGSESCGTPTPTPTPTATPTPTPTATPTPAPGLVAAYGFNDGSGTVVNDASGNGNNGIINGATWTTSGK